MFSDQYRNRGFSLGHDELTYDMMAKWGNSSVKVTRLAFFREIDEPLPPG